MPPEKTADPTPDIIDTAAQRLIDAYNKHKKAVTPPSTKTALPFDPSVLLDLATTVITACIQMFVPTDPTIPTANVVPAAADNVKATVAKKPLLARFMIRRSMRASGYLARPDADAIVEAMMDTGTTSTAAEIASFYTAASTTYIV